MPFPSPGDLPNPGIKPRSPALPADSLPRPSLSESTALTAAKGPEFPVKLSKASVRLSRAHSWPRLPPPRRTQGLPEKREPLTLRDNRAQGRRQAESHARCSPGRLLPAQPSARLPWARLETGHPSLPCPAVQSQVWPSLVAGVDVLPVSMGD